MKALVVGGVLLAGMLIVSEQVTALSQHIVISQVQAGGASGSNASTQEFFTLYNNSSEEVDVTGWCIENKSSSTIACLTPSAHNETVYLLPMSYAVFASDTYTALHPEQPGPPPVEYDVVYPAGSSGKITGSSDTLSLYTSNKTLVDQVAWTSLSGGQTLERRSVSPGLLLETDLSSDFQKTSLLSIPQSGIRFERAVIDLCATIDGIQETLPYGYGYDDAGDCELISADTCVNLENIQLQPPAGMLADTASHCYDDLCANIEGLQITIPSGFIAEDFICSQLENRALIINELLANSTGSDIGNEFIELYNPFDEPVSLSGYILWIGKQFEKSYKLSDVEADLTIQAKGYLVVTDEMLGYSLLNSSSGVRLISPAGTTVSESSYNNPEDDHAWALLNGNWTYTNRPSPGGANIPSSISEEEDIKNGPQVLASCVAGKYRHPITTRCRNIENDTSMLVACDDDEYRNLDTNRCRKVASLATALAPCKDGYARNESTNRCRSVAGAAATLAACQTGYERNATTNRCRKVLQAAVAATNAVSPKTDTQNDLLKNSLVLAAGLGAVGYGLYEWRSEVFRGVRRVVQYLISK